MAYTSAPDGWWQEFLSALPAHTAELAVVKADGSPHVAPVWIDLDDDEVMFTTGAETLKGKAILAIQASASAWTTNGRRSAS